MEDTIKMIIDDVRKNLEKKLQEKFSERSRKFYYYILPAIDIIEDKTELTIFVDLPGFDKSEISVTIVDNVLKLEAHRKLPELEGVSHLKERPDEIRRNIHIPIPVEKDKINAKYENGILTIKIPIKAGAKVNIQ